MPRSRPTERRSTWSSGGWRPRSPGYLQPGRPLRAHGDDEAPLRRLLAPLPLDDAPDADRRAGADRRPRVPALSTAAPRDRPGRAPPRRRRRLGADGGAPAHAPTSSERSGPQQRAGQARRPAVAYCQPTGAHPLTRTRTARITEAGTVGCPFGSRVSQQRAGQARRPAVPFARSRCPRYVTTSTPARSIRRRVSSLPSSASARADPARGRSAPSCRTPRRAPRRPGSRARRGATSAASGRCGGRRRARSRSSGEMNDMRCITSPAPFQ